VAQWQRALARRYRLPIACGEASSELGSVWLAGPRAGGIDVLSTDPLRVSLRAAPGYDMPYLVYQREGEAPERLVLDVPLPAQVELEGVVDPALVQLVATGPTGPAPVALRAVGSPSPPTIDADDPRAWVNALRETFDRPRLRENRLLADAAMRHAEAVCRTGRVGHVATRGDDPTGRLRDQGISARMVGEVVARGHSVFAGLDGLLASPSHLYTILEPRFTDVGIGITEGRDSCVCIVFAAWPMAVARERVL
jgi:uncharacterized protein YkwD